MSSHSTSRFFHSLDREIEARLRSVGNSLEVEVGDLIVEEGNLDRSLFLVESGEFSVLQRGPEGNIQIGRITSGDVFGEISFLDSRPRSASVVAATDSRILKIDHHEALKALADSPEYLGSFLSDLSNRAVSHLSEGTRTSAPDFDDEEIGDFLDRLQKESLEHRGVKHPYLDALGSGDLPDPRWALRDFARNYIGYASHFPRFLTGVISTLSMPEERAVLLENLTEENGNFSEEELEVLTRSGIDREWIEGYPRPLLLNRFCEAIGAGNCEPEEDAIEVVCWREMFFSILNSGSPTEALGALGFATEGVVGEIYHRVIDAIERQGDIEPRDSVFFHLHAHLDSRHRDALREISATHAASATGRQDLRKGMNKALSLRGAFWDWLHSRALAAPKK